MSVVRIEQSDVELFQHTDPRQAIRGIQQGLLPKLKRLRSAALRVAEQRLAVEPKSLMPVDRPANRPDAKAVMFSHEAYAGVSWPRSENPLAVKTSDGKPRFYPPTYLYFGLYPDGHLRVQLQWYRYNVEEAFRQALRSFVESQGFPLLDALNQRGIRSSNSSDEPLPSTLDSASCRWIGKPLAIPIVEGDAAWNEAIECFVFLLPLALVAWKLAVGEVPTLGENGQHLREELSPNTKSERDGLLSPRPDEVDPAGVYLEGAVHRVLVNAYERNPEARRRSIEHHGSNCCICGFSFGLVYGEVAEGVIHVHHLRPLSEVGKEYIVDPVEDLRPVCPNCHAVLHRRVPAYSIEEVRMFRQKQRQVSQDAKS